MPQSLAQVLIHTIFSTKHREPDFRNPDFRAELRPYMGGVSEKLGCQPIQIGGTPDHVHLLTTLSRTVTIADFVKEVKRVSTNWVQQQDSGLAKFHWQAGYGTFSVSESNKQGVIDYILNQEEHHRKMTFQGEFRRFLDRHGLAYDERYVWD